MLDLSPYGPRALLARFATDPGELAFARARSLDQALARTPPPGLTEVVPAFTTLLLLFDPHVVPDPATLIPELRQTLLAALDVPPEPGPIREIPVVYDGPDLQRVAASRRLSLREVIASHSTPVYRVYHLGFAPGFPYLGELPDCLHTPRLPTPRARVPAGSVAIGGRHTGIYPVDGPGGWNLIGRTPLRLFDPARAADGPASIFLLHPGDRVRFIPIEP